MDEQIPPDSLAADHLKRMADQVAARAAALLPKEIRAPLDPLFVKQCLDANERGDGCLYASLHQEKFRYNTTPKDGEWYSFGAHVWERDRYRRSMAAVEDCALEYLRLAELLEKEIRENKIVKGDEDFWKVKLLEKYQGRINRLRSVPGVAKVLTFAPVVEPAMACEESDFDNQPWLLPCRNGVIDLQTGVLTAGRPEDMLTRSLDLDYDPHADYGPWQKVIDEIAVEPEIASFIKRSFGYAATGHSLEQYIWVFTGPGRNGKGVLFELIGEVLGPYYHEISRSMLIEQRSEPSPAATSEHLYSLLGKRMLLAAETNKNHKIDAGAIKALTGENKITCRPLFKSEINFMPTHSTFLQTNHIPYGLTKDFALVQRLLKVEFPLMFVDDVEAEQKKYPAKASLFRKKDPHLKAKLREFKPGILRWLVEGCLEWQQLGISPPASIRDGVTNLASEEDYIGQYMRDCLHYFPDDDIVKMPCKSMYAAFQWWWSENMDPKEQRMPAMKTVNKEFRERGHSVEMTGGKTYIYRFAIKPEIETDVATFIARGGAKS